MSYIEKARQNRANAEKAQAFDTLNQQHRDRQAYDAGAGDAYTEVEQQLMARAQQEAMQRQIAEASQQQMFANQDVRGPAEIPVLPAPRESYAGDNGLAAATVQQNMRDSAYNTAIAQASSDGNMSEDYINQLVEQELLQRGGL